MSYITRIAPSPTGDFHLGTARTAYFNWLAARASGGEFILRIDDTDPERSSEEYVKPIFEAMEWLGLDYDNVYRQSESLDYYRDKAEWLIEQGFAHRIDGGAIALNIEDDGCLPICWHDQIGGCIPISEDDRGIIKRTVIIRSDGVATYNFATVCDDCEMGVNLIIRGVDHISNTCRQVSMCGLLGCPHLPEYCHVGLIHKDGKKLSKRDGAASVLWYRDQGYHPEALLNFLLRMGWGPTVDDKSVAVIPRERALELFLEGGKMRSQSANFDQAKLDSFDRKYKARVTA